MAPNTKRVFYVKYVAAPIFLEILARRPDVQVDRLENDSPRDVADPVLRMAHAYQIGAARDEIVLDYHATSALLARTPNLLAVSSNGAGYDTVDVDACTAAGVIAVNQAGGNKEAVAEHVLAMMLTLSKRIVETDRYMRRQSDIPRNDFIGHDLTGRTIGIIGLGHVGSRVAELCRGLFRHARARLRPVSGRGADRRARRREGDARRAAGAIGLRLRQLPRATRKRAA